MAQKFDSIIFDMDGTLWDAVDSYCKIWDKTFNQMNIVAPITSRDELLNCMGLPIDEIFKRIVKVEVDKEEYLRLLDINEKEMMPLLGGTLYQGVKEGIPQLAKHYRLFMVSNCGALGLKNFTKFTQLEPYIEDTLTFGETLLNKAQNISLLIERNNLSAPIYMGDTRGDSNSAHAAGIPMIFAEYGFGECSDAEYSVESFTQFVDLFTHF